MRHRIKSAVWGPDYGGGGAILPIIGSGLRWLGHGGWVVVGREEGFTAWHRWGGGGVGGFGHFHPWGKLQRQSDNINNYLLSLFYWLLWF